MLHTQAILSVLCLGALTFGLAPADANANGGKKNLVFNLLGTGAMYTDTVPDIDGDGVDDEAICFDVDLVDPSKGTVIGSATDCLASIQEGDNGGLALVGTSYFDLPQGSIVTRGATTVQPVNHPTAGFTHITGANGPDNAILSGTGPFAGATGTVRLSGMVDMSGFGGEVGDPITFDCLFVIDRD